MRAHHGSLAREQRVQVESELKAGTLRAIVATSSLELGIDMGTVDLVVLVESPGSVARGLQRIGRAGHQVGEPSTGKIFPKYRGDLLEAAVVVQRMREGLVEEMRYPRNPLDVLAQQLVAACAIDEWDVDELASCMRRCANFADLSDDAFRETLDLLAGRYPSDRFAGLRPRVVWDRVQNRVRGREGRAACRGAERRHDPRPRIVRRLLARRRPRRRARRGDGVREPRRRMLRARRVHMADRRDHRRPCGRYACARRARQDSVLARRPARPSARARTRAGPARARGARAPGRSRAAGADGIRARRARRIQPARVSRRAG